MHHILVADPAHDLESWIESIAHSLSASVTTTLDGEALESALFGQGPFDLVVTAAQLKGKSGLQVLARARSLKLGIPFIVVTSLHGHLARVMVSDSSTQTLSSRMLDRTNLATLARGIVRAADRTVGCDAC